LSSWSDWRDFPDPTRGGYLFAPFGPGVYALRRKSTGELILFGSGKNVAHRMTSLLPAPLGAGTRHNEAKRAYVLEHLGDLEYQTLSCLSESEAKAEESDLSSRERYHFHI
jgi:hypothetical protein